MSKVKLSEGFKEVRRIMEKCPESRNSDLLLTWIYFKEVLGVNMPPLSPQDLVRLEGKLETVRRMRAHIQNDLKILPPTKKEILDKRRQKADDYLDWFREHAGEKLR